MSALAQDYSRSPVRARIDAGVQAFDFTGYKPQAVVLQHSQRGARVEFAELFGFERQTQTVGEHMNILRAWVRINRLPEINERFSICEFASVFERYVKPRHAWRHFWRGEERIAREFLAQWASALLPQVVN